MAHARLIHLLRVGLVAAVAAWGAGCTLYPSAPADPAYDTDVRPIFLAHCTRCHGAGPADGGLNPLNLNPGTAVNYNNPSLNCYPLTAGHFVFPSDGGGEMYSVPDLTRYGPCGVVDGGAVACNPRRGGAGAYAGLIQSDVHARGTCAQMPPAPAPTLDDWETKVIDAWTAKMPPVCSHSSNPNPALLCP